MAAPPANFVPIPAPLFGQPGGTYGIAFDLRTRAMSDDLPDGWALHRSTIYSQIKRALMGFMFTRVQGSLYHRQDSAAALVWAVMIDLRRVIEPIGVIPTVVRKMEMFFVSVPHAMIAEGIMTLGGAASPFALGPTPINLFPDNIQPIPLIGPPHPWPKGTRPTFNARNGANWGI